jgi:hypothetical protein
MSEAVYGPVSIDEIVEIGQTVPPGRYVVRMISCDAKASSKGNPMLVVTYEVMQGEHEGLEATCYYTLMAVKGKDGRVYAGGLTELRKIFAAVGKPLPAGYKWELGNPSVPNSNEKSMALYRKMFMEKVSAMVKLEMLIVPDKNSPRKNRDTDELVKDDDGNQLYNSRRTIVGLANRSVAPSASNTQEYTTAASSSSSTSSAESPGSTQDELSRILGG